MAEAERKRFGELLKQAREEAGLNQGQLAAELGYASDRSVRYWEAGERLKGAYENLDRICRVTSKDKSFFFPDRGIDARIDRIDASLAEINAALRELIEKLPGPGGVE